jgi:hypothetical protein
MGAWIGCGFGVGSGKVSARTNQFSFLGDDCFHCAEDAGLNRLDGGQNGRAIRNTEGRRRLEIYTGR